jgi:hypothetical protein
VLVQEKLLRRTRFVAKHVTVAERNRARADFDIDAS